MRARYKVPASIPFFLTEYSVMVGEGMAAAKQFRHPHMYGEQEMPAVGSGNEPPYQHDGGGAAAFVFRVVPQLSPHLGVMSYCMVLALLAANMLENRSDFLSRFW
jgi:hypothetical protein